MSKSIALILCFSYYSHCARAQNGADIKPERIQLENGATLLLAPFPDAKVVAVEILYRVGFCDEPAGMTQAAHLLEHLMCQGETKSYGPGESFALLRRLGTANAETLPTFTHYNYTAPPEELETILKIEAEKLNSLKITPELISDEADKCHEEAQFVYKNPQSGMVKHAFMALFQFWNHGATEVRVRSGVDQLPADKLDSFFRAQYRPDQLTIAIVGSFQKDEALALAKEHLGAVPSRKVEQKPLDWNSLPHRAHITWDADVHAICIYAPPPADPKDRALLSLWGFDLMLTLGTHDELRNIAHMSFTSNTSWPVGDLPLFVYATAKSPDKLQQTEQVLKDCLRGAVKKLATNPADMLTFSKMITRVPIPAWKELQTRASELAKLITRTDEELMPGVLGNVALEWGLRHLSGIPSAEEVEFASTSVQRLTRYLDESFDAATLRTVTLGPPPETEPTP